ncbi:hypothetical protein ACFQ1I_44670 [Kitasatospora arboriphila]
MAAAATSAPATPRAESDAPPPSPLPGLAAPAADSGNWTPGPSCSTTPR